MSVEIFKNIKNKTQLVGHALLRTPGRAGALSPSINWFCRCFGLFQQLPNNTRLSENGILAGRARLLPSRCHTWLGRSLALPAKVEKDGFSEEDHLT